MKARGFALATVVLLLALIATSVFLVTRAAGTGVDRAVRSEDAAVARYAAQAGLTHAIWLANYSACTGYALPSTPFGGHSYLATYSPTADSPVAIKAVGVSANGAQAQISRTRVTVYDLTNPKTLSLQFDASSGKDAILDDFYPIRNYGGSNYVAVNSAPGWIQRPVFEFDLSAIPASAKVLSATFELKQTGVGSAGVAGVHRLNRSWVEGTKNGGGVADGATWQTADGSTAWTQQGGDFDPTLFAQTAISSAGNGLWVSWELRDLAQRWVSGALPNFGLLLAGDGALSNASFESREGADPLDSPRLTVSYVCECGVACGPKVLMVVVDPGGLTAQEILKKGLIESWGYTVNLIGESDSQASFDTALAENDAVYVTLSIDAGNLGTKLLNATVGVVNEAGELVDELGFGQDKIYKSRDEIDVVDNTHYITQLFATGLLNIAASAQPVHMLSGPQAPGLHVLGESFNAGSLWGPSLAALNPGDDLYGGGAAAGRRVQLPWGSGLFDINALTPDGRTIMQRAIEWAADVPVPGTGPIAHWKFDETSGTNAVDSEGSHDGTLVNGPGWATPAQVDGGLDFDGIDDYVDAGSFDVVGTGLTMVGWFNADTIPTSDGRIISKADGANDFNAWWQLSTTDAGSNRYIRMRIKAGGTTTTFADSTVNLTTGRWYFAVATYANTTGEMRLYLDGIEVANGTHAVGGPVNTAPAVPVAIGANGTAERFFDGILDDVRVYNLALSATEIADLYAEGGGSAVAYQEFVEEKRNSSVTDVNISKPPGSATGDLLIAAIATDGDTAASLALPVEWNVIDIASHSGAVTLGVWWKLVSAAEPANYTFTWIGGEKAYATVMRFTGHDPVTPINTSAGSGGASNSPLSPAVTTTVADTMILRIGGFDDDDVTIDSPGLSGHTAITMDKTGNGTGTASAGAGYVLQPAAADSGTSNFSLNATEEYRAVTIAITPQ